MVEKDVGGVTVGGWLVVECKNVLLHIGEVRLLRQGNVTVLVGGDPSGFGEPEALGVAWEFGKSVAAVADPMDFATV